MARNPYQVLGVPQTASDSDIRAAFRKLAKEHHPDRNPGDGRAEERFKEISAAFDILGDTDRRRRFDAGEIDEQGQQRPPFYRHWQSQGSGPRPPGGEQTYSSSTGGPGAGASFEDLGDIFADLFGSKRGAGYAGAPQRGRDARYRLEVDFLDAVTGAKKRVTMPDGRTLDIAIPPGLDDGQTLRLRGQGERGPGGAGDVYVEVKIAPHALFRREGSDIHVEAPITLREAVLGGKITVPTISGDVSLTVPKWTNSGAVLRLRGRGVPAAKGGAAGDQYVKLRIVLPEGGDAELERFVREWTAGERQSRRRMSEVD